VTTQPQIPRCAEDVKARLVLLFANALDLLLADAASGAIATARGAEQQVWSALLPVGCAVLTAVFSAMCLRTTELALAATGRTMADVWMRMDVAGFVRLMSTFGPVRFPVWSFRETRGGETRCPAKALFPMHPQTRSSMLCMEWEAALAADHPFRRAASALLFFTHNAVNLEDTTVAYHAVRAGMKMSHDWMYKTSAEIRRILVERATVDRVTGRPLIYASTDAHALSMYTNWTWDSGYQMWNGIRVWCIDRHTGQIIHLGGDFANDDCRGVAARFVALQTGGQLPANGDYGDGVVAQIVFPSDGAWWIVDHVLPLFVDAIAVLDVYHVLEKVTEFALNAYPRSKRLRRRLFQQALRALGMPPRRKREAGRLRSGPATAKGEPKGRRDPKGSGRRLLGLLQKAQRPSDIKAADKCDGVEAFIANNVDRMNYGDMDARGMQIGSGAMESIHRSGSQVRLKRSGCHWTDQTAQAILNLRMLGLSGRWDEYWGQATLGARMAKWEVT
jgi:hypothetical protein